MLAGKQVLVVEDNRELQGVLSDFLEVKGAEAGFADNGELALKLAMEHTFDAIIMDVMMPKKDGIQVTQALRDAGCNTPILMLTALNGQDDLLGGFASGVDDFVSKPFQLAELEVRLNALIKRYHGLVAKSLLTFGELSIDQSAHKVTRNGIPLEVNPFMYQILVMLVKAHGQLVSRASLIQALWGDEPPEKDLLRSHIYLLRNVLDKPFDKNMLVTVPRFGLKLEA